MSTSWTALPEKFREKLTAIVPNDRRESVLESFCQRRPSTFRANTLKISPDDLEKKLKDLGIETERVPWYKDAFLLKNVPQKVLTETDLYKNGYFYVQSLSSMIPPLILDPKPGERILDLTAAPGSKTTQIAALMENSGEILANDKSRIRMFKLEANVKMQGVTNSKMSYLPGEFLWKRYPEYFDRTLVDVPCSMEGRFFIEDEKTFRDWTPRKVKQLAEMQKWLLRSAVSATAPGGIIIYSTCTLSPEENEEVVNWILKKEQGALDIEEVHIPHLSVQPGVTRYKQRVFDERLSRTLRIYPSTTMEGFFVAKLKKNTSTLHFEH